MKRFLLFMVLNMALFAQIGSAQSEEFTREQLSVKGRVAYNKLAAACIFGVGGVGYAGETTKEELALYDLLEEPHALAALKSLVKMGSYEGGLYGLLGLSIKDHGEFNRAVEIYKVRNERPEWQETCSFRVLSCYRRNRYYPERLHHPCRAAREGRKRNSIRPL